MRFVSIAGMGLAALALAGCVVATPQQGAAPSAPTQPATPAEPVLDSASRALARNTINAEMEKRLPGADVSPYTDCVVNSASTSEMLSIASSAQSGGAGAANTVASIVTRPEVSQCIQNVAATA